MKRLFFLSLVFAFLLSGCVQSSPSGSTPTPQIVYVTVTPAPASTPAATLVPAVSVPPSTPAPSLTPSPVAASVTPVPIVAEKPDLENFARSLEPVFSSVFNKTRKIYDVTYDQWSIDDVAPLYNIQMFIQKSKSSSWSSFEKPFNVTGFTTNRTREVVVLSESQNTYYRTLATFKCYDWAYEIQVDLKDFDTVNNEFKRSLGKHLVSRLVDVCP